MAGITSANIVLTFQQPVIFPTPVVIQGFANDDVTDVDAIQATEVSMGVDGLLSGGFVFQQVAQNISLQADSDSNDFFDGWYLQGAAAKDVYPISGVMILPSVFTKWTLTKGFLTSYAPAPAAKRILQPRRYQVTWERITPSPL